jgi:23S rRNA (cytidine1920-2'-O)/16S rRNA (cytidine1409-2'-O)-methyltransferase
LVRRRLVDSRTAAADLISAGHVLVGGVVADKPSRLVGPGEPVKVTGPARRFVSRGGEKLEAALSGFGVDPTGLRALDAGASTGGFTDCLLQHGAASVVAVDVGRGQIHERIRADPRVEVRERTDVRSFSVEDAAGELFDLVVADLSFISLRTVAEPLLALARPGAEVVVLVKPQFEAGRREVSRGRGVIRDPDIWRQTLLSTITALESAGSTMMGIMASPLRGTDGNVEFLVHLRRQGAGLDPAAQSSRAGLVPAAQSSRAGLDPAAPASRPSPGPYPRPAGPIQIAVDAAVESVIARDGD